MNNYDFDRQATELAANNTAYALARHLVKEREINARLTDSLDAKDRIIRAQEATGNALAAHVEQITLVFLQGFESSEDHDLDAWEDDAKAVLARQPSTSLAQRDARMKETTSRELAMKWPPDSVMRSRLLEFAEEYRQQAEGLCVDEGCPHHGTDHVCINRQQAEGE